MPPDGMATATTPARKPGLARIAADLEKRGETGTAIALYERAASVSGKKDPAAYVGLGDIYRRSGRLEAAEKAYREALEREPKHAGALLGLGTLLVQRGKIDEAVVALEAAAPQLGTSTAWNRLGIAQTLAGRLDDAQKSLSRALYYAPSDIDVRTNLALAASLAGRHDAAIATMRQVVGFSQAELRHHKNLIIVLALAGRVADARKAAPSNLTSGDLNALVSKAKRIADIKDPKAKAKALGTVAG